MSPLTAALLFMCAATLFVCDMSLGIYMASNPYRRAHRRAREREAARIGIAVPQHRLHLPHLRHRHS